MRRRVVKANVGQRMTVDRHRGALHCSSGFSTSPLDMKEQSPVR
jgi:hypothetical protein